MAQQLAIDIGNSRTKFGVFQNNELLEVSIINNSDLQSSSKLKEYRNFKAVVISSVNSIIEQIIIEKLNFKEQLILSHKTNIPITLNYKTPETLGKDRIAAVVGANFIHKSTNVLVVDIGTCVTYDFLTAKAAYLGGAISPGVQLRLNAMHSFTNKLPQLNWDTEKEVKMLGDSTIGSMLSGAVLGLKNEIEGYINQYKKQYLDLKIVLTGGDANFFEKELKNGIFADPNLVLKGLNEILLYNRS